jgi:hypothetical protein
LVIGNRSFVIPFKRDCLSTIGGTCAFDAKISGFLGVRFQLSRCGVRNKKNFKFTVFGVRVAALLIGFLITDYAD